MIITRTPLRVSLVGGGTDIQKFYKNKTGKVISMAINKYVYVIIKKQTGVIENKFKFYWNGLEQVDNLNSIKNLFLKKALQVYQVNIPLEIISFSDIPPETGLGSSSAFTVGLLKALDVFIGFNRSKYELASFAADFEINQLKRKIGKQDHFASVYGSINKFSFNKNETVGIDPIIYDLDLLKLLESNLYIYNLSLKRDASNILKKQFSNRIDESIENYQLSLVDEMENLLSNPKKWKNIGLLLDKNWELKKNQNPSATNKKINRIYNIGIKNGSTGGKLLGAGGGGFLLFYVPRSNKKKFLAKLNNGNLYQFKIDHSGSRVTYYDNTD